MKRTHSSLTLTFTCQDICWEPTTEDQLKKPSLVGLSNYWIQSYHTQLPIVGLVGLKTVSHYNTFLNV